MSEAIGILGGTFDPIHFGHLRPALDVAEQLELDHIRLIPSARPPHREQPLATPEQRLLMLHLAVKNSQQFVVDDRELHREGASYTVDTLLSLRQDFPDSPLYLLIGTDAFFGIQTWHNWQRLIELAHIVVMQRPNEKTIMPDELNNWYQQHLATDTDIELIAGKIWPIKVSQLEISATEIRSKITQGLTPQFLMPDAVIQLIEQLGLYKDNG
ncbi:MAG: nicotinate-nucleotide adenylyltransferase [Gammaproteobacteria bacterium]|nr:MAG: nicotinate-nucleotide adenylyltransferase [Gammaproteobacteria bacterium]